jgi:multicomponent Na+:H+ antiporter subunit F
VAVLAASGTGMFRLLKGPTDADRMMAAQLAGSGAATVCLLLSVASGIASIADVAVILGLLAAIAIAALSLQPASGRDREP